MKVVEYFGMGPRFHPKFSLLAARTEFRALTIYSTTRSIITSIEFLFYLLGLHTICRPPRYSYMDTASVMPFPATFCQAIFFLLQELLVELLVTRKAVIDAAYTRAIGALVNSIESILLYVPP